MATRVWVGGTGTWDATDTTHWAAASGGAGGQSVPTSADDAAFDSASGGGTITINGNFTVKSLTTGTYTGTLDWSVNNNNLIVLGTAAFSDFAANAKTFKFGSGTFQADSITLFQGSGITFQPGTSLWKAVVAGPPATSFSLSLVNSFTWPNIEVGPDTSWPLHTFANSPVITNLTLTGPAKIRGNITITVTNLTGTASAKGKGPEVRGEPTQTWVLTNPGVFHWAVLRGLNFTSAGIRAYNSMNGGGCTNVTFSPPKYGRIIGG